MSLARGAALGPYEVVELIGVGGMGEVYRARDPRLGRDVAIKILPAGIADDAGRLHRFEQEARAVAALNHPHILTVFDIGSHGGTPYVVTELLDGENLREVLARRPPTQRQVVTLALQVAQGLGAAHQKGIVHRDVKPENLFLTTEGRAKILDFGLARFGAPLKTSSPGEAKGDVTRAGFLMGTVAYMSPEQASALSIDPRSDLFSFGIVLYELLSGRHPFRRETAEATVEAILYETPPAPSSLEPTIPPALDGIVRRCLEKDREERFQSAHEMAVALEAVLKAPAGAASLAVAEQRSPYLGLQSFTEKNAGVFFGRETEVQALWQRLQSRRLLAVIGPSGAGKTSFVRAGVVASRPEGWGAIVCKPGTTPLRSLALSVAPELADDSEAVTQLLSSEDPEIAIEMLSRWRRRHCEALLVVDQFEELFTLNRPESQAGFAALLGRLASDAGIHVLLSLRDDFLMRCHEHDPLAPVFSDLTPLGALTTEGLRLALTEPARKLGYRFEDDALVDEMVASVEGARGALPLLAFAVARLWEKRERNTKFLTWGAYEDIGRVAGALAQHAEAVMARIGSEQHGIVRELFRQLVTAQGTRAVLERDELLSAFQDRPAAEQVLGALIDARLLTSYEVEESQDRTAGHRVEIVHESLLDAWPRLVRWQAQDEEGAVLRDHLRQAARLWNERNRTGDLLWMGTAYQEFELWRERYPGQLSAVESDFARAMAEKARKRKMLIRASIVAAFVVLAGISIAIGISRFQAVRARDEATAAAQRAEAGRLLALARVGIDQERTIALAYVRKSLELADTPEARRLAVEILWRGPVARTLDPETFVEGLQPEETGHWGWSPAFSPDSNWLALQNDVSGRIFLFSSGGGPPRVLPRPPDGDARALDFGPRSDVLITGGPGSSLRLLSLPDLHETGRVELGGVESTAWVSGDRLMTVTRTSREGTGRVLRAWPLPGGSPEVLAKGDWAGPNLRIDREGRWLAGLRDRELFVRALDEPSTSRGRTLGRLADDLAFGNALSFFPRGRGAVSLDKSGNLQLWSWASSAPQAARLNPGPKPADSLMGVDPQGRYVAATTGNEYGVWDLDDPPDAGPLTLRESVFGRSHVATFDHDGRWLVTSNMSRLQFWPTATPWRRELPTTRAGSVWAMAFTPDARWLSLCPIDYPVRLYPLSRRDGNARDLVPEISCYFATARPRGSEFLASTWRDVQRDRSDGRVFLYQIPGGPVRQLLTGWEGSTATATVAFDRSGRRAIACPGWGPDGSVTKLPNVIRVWDLDSGGGRTYPLSTSRAVSDNPCQDVGFAPDGSAYVAGNGGVLRCVFPDDPGSAASCETVHAAPMTALALSPDGRQLLILAGREPFIMLFDEMILLDLAARTSRRITTHGHRLFVATFDPSGRFIVTGDHDGIVRVGPVTGDEPHLLLGHHSLVESLEVSPDGRWIATANEEGLYLWPMPDMTRPPLHTLPHDELLRNLDALTNLRLVPDPSSSAGWKLDVGPFPGWKDVPTW